MAIVDGKIRCYKCKQWKDVSEYQASVVAKGCGACRTCKYQQKMAAYAANPEKGARQARENRAKRRDQVRQYGREFLAADRDRAKGYNLKRYGITLDQYQQMLENQGGGCAICGAKTNTNGKALFVDHCHDTGRVRGVLCHKCNTGLGSFKDNAILLAKAVSYLNGSD